MRRPVQRRPSRRTSREHERQAPVPTAQRSQAEEAAQADSAEGRLQRARRLGHQVANLGTPTANRSRIQRSFGFEAELGLSLNWSDQAEADKAKDQYSRPDGHLTKMPIAASGTGIEVHVDHQKDAVDGLVPGSTSIAELVTKPPIDESTTSEADVRQRMQQMTAFVADASAKTSALSQRAKLGDITNVTGTEEKEGHLFVGANSKGGQQLDTGYMQSTFVVKFDKAPEVLDRYKDKEQTASVTTRAAADHSLGKKNVLFPGIYRDTGLWDALRAGKVAESEPARYVAPWDASLEIPFAEIVPTLKEQLAPLLGITHLMLHYLSVGKVMPKNANNNLRKNHLGQLYYKTSLASAVGELTGASAWAVATPERREAIQTALLTAAARDEAEPMQKAFEDDVFEPWTGEWIEGVLSATEDKVFDQSKNDYSKEIEPYDVGAEGAKSKGLAIESRRVAPSTGFTYDDVDGTRIEDANQRPVGDWEDIGVALWRFLREVNEIPDDDAETET